jgi:hypothetical protein
MATRADESGNRDGARSTDENNLESDKDPSSDKLSQDAKGEIEFLQYGRAIIDAFQTTDLSTIHHKWERIACRYPGAKSLAYIENRAGVEKEKFVRPYIRRSYYANFYWKTGRDKRGPKGSYRVC